jgi:hypothetical protein
MSKETLARRTVVHAARLRESEAALIDSVRGTIPRGTWLREAALTVARSKDAPPVVGWRSGSKGGEARTVQVHSSFLPSEDAELRATCRRLAAQRQGAKCSPAEFMRDAALWLAAPGTTGA